MDETPAVEQGDIIDDAEVYGDITHEIEAQERAMEDAIYEDDETRSVVEADDTEIRSVIEDDENRSVDNTEEDVQEEEKNDDNDDASEDNEVADRRYNLRSRNTRDYSHRFDHIMDNPASKQSYDVQLLQNAVSDLHEGGPSQPVLKHLTAIIMTQMTEKAGIKKHGKAAVTALFNDFFQLDDKTVFKGVDASKLRRK